MNTWINALVAFAFTGFRFAGYKSQSFQAFSHLYVGGLFGAWFVGGGLALLWIAIALSLAELTAFLLGLKTKALQLDLDRTKPYFDHGRETPD